MIVGVKEMTLESLQIAYGLAENLLDMRVRKNPREFRKIPVADTSLRIKPIDYLMSMHREYSERIQTYAYRNAEIAVMKKSGNIGKGYFESLSELLFIKRRFPERRIATKDAFERYMAGEDRLRKQYPFAVEAHRIYTHEILSKIVEVAPAIGKLEKTAFEKLILEKEAFDRIIMHFGGAEDWFIAEKQLNHNSLDAVAMEIERLPEILDEYFYWTYIA